MRGCFKAAISISQGHAPVANQIELAIVVHVQQVRLRIRCTDVQPIEKL